MKVCLDANVVIDIIGATKDMLTSYAAADVCLLRGYELCIPASTLSTIVYVVPTRKFKSEERAKKALQFLTEECTLLDLTASDCRQAFEGDMPDFENAIIAYSSYRQGVDAIVTRNKKDFAASPVPAMTPEEFLQAYKPSNVTYDQLDGQIFAPVD